MVTVVLATSSTEIRVCTTPPLAHATRKVHTNQFSCDIPDGNALCTLTPLAPATTNKTHEHMLTPAPATFSQGPCHTPAHHRSCVTRASLLTGWPTQREGVTAQPPALSPDYVATRKLTPREKYGLQKGTVAKPEDERPYRLLGLFSGKKMRKIARPSSEQASHAMISVLCLMSMCGPILFDVSVSQVPL